LVELLSRTTFSFPHIVGVDWRLNYFIKSNSVERENKPVYFIRLKTNAPTAPPSSGSEGSSQQQQSEDVEFTCSAWELIDLHTKLRDAAKQFERITNSS
jgi:hypothetical protein